MEGGPSDFQRGSSCLVVLWILLCQFEFRLLDYHHLWLAFPYHSTILIESRLQSLTPDVFLLLVWALPLSLAATYRIDFSFFSCGYLDVSVPHVSRLTHYLFMCGQLVSSYQLGFPIRIPTDRGSFAAPRGLSQLIASFFGSRCQGILPMLFVA